MSTLFISDLHLSEQRPKIISLFLEFLDTRAKESDALYILGDLFEFWTGDEVGSLPQVKPILEAIKKLADSNVPVYVMHGNRDFLLGKEFVKMTGCQLINDPAIIELNGVNVLLMHGDTLCTDDKDYMKFRSIVRDPKWQADFLSKTIEERTTIANNYRDISKKAINEKTAEIMDANQEAVAEIMKKHNVKILIHGHTHRPNRHEFDLDGSHAIRIVLGDWYEQGSILICDQNGCSLEKLQKI